MRAGGSAGGRTLRPSHPAFHAAISSGRGCSSASWITIPSACFGWMKSSFQYGESSL